MKKKPLPQFNSHAEAIEFYSKYGKFDPPHPHGRIGANYEWLLYTYKVRDGRRMALKISNDGRVEEHVIPKRNP